MRKSIAILLGFLLASGTLFAQQYLITTIAGGGGLPLGPVPATSVAVGTTSAVAADANGDVYFIASNCVFKVDASGLLTRVAGSSTVQGYSGDGGPAAGAQLGNPGGVAVDATGNLYIADYFNNVIRKVALATGIITTVAGNGTPGHSGDGGPAVNAQLSGPIGVALDAAGNLYIADYFNSVVRKVTAATGIITTVAGNGSVDFPVISGDGGPATSAGLGYPQAVAVDAAGDIYIASGDAVRKVTAATGIITTVAGGDTAPLGPEDVAVDAAGNLYISEVSSNVILKLTAATGSLTTVAGNGSLSYGGDGGPATSAGLNQPRGVAVDAAGNLYIGDGGDSVIRKVTAATGIITTIAGQGQVASGGPGRNLTGDSGDGGPATSAQLSPGSVAVDGSGNLYIADGSHSVVRQVVAATSIITRVAGTGTPGYSGDGGPTTRAQLDDPGGVAGDAAGNLYIADTFNNVIREVTAATGIIATVSWTLLQLGDPGALAVDGSGNMYVVDGGVIRKVPSAPGLVTTVAGIPGAAGIALDGAGNLYVADPSYSVIRKLAAGTGIITIVAGNSTLGYSGDGGPATSAALNQPEGIAVDGAGNLYIADTYNNVIRKVAASSGIITTIAGNGTAGYSGDGGLASSARLNWPQSLAVDSGGNVYVADVANSVIRMLVPMATRALLGITSTHSADFASGQTSASYVLVVSNAAGAGPTSSTVTVTETAPAGLTPVSMSGAGWGCSVVTCTRNDVLSPGASYPPITVTVNVAGDAPSLVMNQAVVSGGGSTAASAADLTTIFTTPPEALLVSPANGATGVVLAPALAWQASPEAASYDVYLGTLSTPPLVATNAAGTSYAPGTLSQNTTYYWQIVARNGIGSTASEIWSFTTGGPAIGLQFVPLTPCRVADTRTAVGPFGGPTMVAQETRSFAIPQSACGIPATAKAYSINTTVVPPRPFGFLTLWPTGEAQPFVSTLTPWDGDVVANAAIVAAGTAGAVSVYVDGPTDVILDINGYFDTPGGANSSSFYAAPPCRVADTRNPTGEFGGPSMFAGQTRDFPIPLSACRIPAGSSAYSLNVTVVPDTNYLAYLTTWPTGQPQPVVSTLNSWFGRPVANAAIVPAGSNGSVSVFVTDPTDVVLDIDGYFGQPGGTGALSFYPAVPCRVADTRNPDGPFGGPEMTAQSTRSFAIPASSCNIPSTAQAYSLNVTVLPEDYLSYLTAWPTGSPQPGVSTLNASDIPAVANAAIIPAGTNGAISVYVTNYTHVIIDINGYFAP